MEFIRTDEVYQKYYDEFVVLLGTGLRVSEFCGLTRNDLDFENRRIRVEHQLCRQRDGTYYIGKPKTASGERYIPMTDEVYQSLKNMIANRPKVKVERIVDGYSGFLMLDKNGNPKVAQHIENEIRGAVKRYQKLHPDSTLRSFDLTGFAYPRDPESPALRELKREITDECRKPSAE